MSYTWDAALRRFRDERGRLVADSAVRERVLDFLAVARTRLAALTQQYLDARLTLPAWEREMRAVIREVHTAAAAVARGGLAQMTRSDWGWTGRRIRTQYDFLREFASDLERARDAGGTGSMTVRAAMYAGAAYGNFSQMQRRMEARAGASEERRYRGKADSCDTCVEEASKGWQPIGSLHAIGDSECVTNCGCYFRYRS